jgi:hypothetical protein
MWVPYTCKRLALDYRRSVQDTKDVRHVAYIGDSILRTSYCGNLYTSFHGELSGPCSYSGGLKEYHYSDKTFSVPIQPSDPSDTREHVTFSQRFVDNDVGKCGDRIRSLRHLEPVTHIIANVGMWFAARQPDDYAGQVAWFLQIVLDTFGRDVKITWLGTPSVAPGILCYKEMNRAYLSRHTSTAASVIAAFKRRYPGLDIGIVDGWPITDHRPETSSDGRWVSIWQLELTPQALGSRRRIAKHRTPASREQSRRRVHGDHLGSMAHRVYGCDGGSCCSKVPTSSMRGAHRRECSRTHESPSCLTMPTIVQPLLTWWSPLRGFLSHHAQASLGS